MNCPTCGKQWDLSNMVTSSTFVCPFCGENIDGSGKIKDNLGTILIRIRDDYGDDIMDDTSRLNALLMDYAPEMTKERKLLINALKEGFLIHIKRYIEENGNLQYVTQKSVSFLVSEMWITEIAAKYIVDVIIKYLGQGSLPVADTQIQQYGKTESKQLTKGIVTFGETINKKDLLEYTSIGYKAFASNSQIKEVDIPDNIRFIYPKAFYNCSSLRQVSIGKGVESIGYGVFDGCNQLSSILVEENSKYRSFDGMLIDKATQKLIRCSNNENTSVLIGNEVKAISKKAFEGLSFEHIRISGTVETIEEDAFFMTMNLREISVDSTNACFRSVDGVLHTRDGKELLRYPQGKKDQSYYLEDEVVKIDKKAFSCAVKLSDITFNAHIKEMGANAFEYCLSLERVLLPRNVEVIGERAFQYCQKLMSVMLPQGIVSIGDCAFLGCELLQTISIPKSVQEIGNMAFSGCKGLRKIVIQDGVKHIGVSAFDECPNVEVSVIGNEYVMNYCKAHNISCAMG